MKKTLLAAALLAALSGSAFAASVTVYGRVDVGLEWAHADNGYDGASQSLSMTSGNYTSNRFGLKGSEDLGNGYQVSFVLENGFHADSGQFKTSGTLFDREAAVHLKTPYGIFAAGRLAPLGTDGGSYNMLGGISAFGTGLGDVAPQGIVMAGLPASRFSNTVTYVTPRMGGFLLQARYSMGEGTSDALENKSSANRYLGLGLSYKAGGFDGVILFEGVNEKSAGVATKALSRGAVKDMRRLTAGGNYDMGFMKAYLAGQYFENADKLGTEGYSAFTKHTLGSSASFDQWKGFGLLGSVDVPFAGGTVKAGAGYVKAKTDELAGGDVKAEGYYTGLAYTYSFSKTTRAVAAFGTSNVAYKQDGRTLAKPSAMYGVCGLAHYF